MTVHDGMIQPSRSGDAAGVVPRWRRGTFLSRLPIADYQALVERGRQIPVVPGTTLGVQGDPSPSVFFLLSGIVKVVRAATAESAATLIDVCGRGDVLGLESLLRGKPGHLTYVTTKPTEFVVISQQTFETYLDRNPQVLGILFTAVAQHACDRDVALSYAGHKVRDRLVAFLMRLQLNHGVADNGVVRIDVGVGHADMASAIGASEISVSREMAKLKKEGFLEMGYRTVIIKKNLQSKLY
jgi:CRP-like cAMP-binding protein